MILDLQPDSLQMVGLLAVEIEDHCEQHEDQKILKTPDAGGDGGFLLIFAFGERFEDVLLYLILMIVLFLVHLMEILEFMQFVIGVSVHDTISLLIFKKYNRFNQGIDTAI